MKQVSNKEGEIINQKQKEKLRSKPFPLIKINDVQVYHVEILYLITLLYCPGCQFTDGFLGSISKTTLMKWERRKHKLTQIIKLYYHRL